MGTLGTLSVGTGFGDVRLAALRVTMTTLSNNSATKRRHWQGRSHTRRGRRIEMPTPVPDHRHPPESASHGPGLASFTGTFEGTAGRLRSSHLPDHPAPCLVETVVQRARRLGVSPLTVRRRIRIGLDPAVQIGGTWRILLADATSLQHLPSECSVRQIANTLGVSELTVRRWIAAGAIPAVKRGRAWIISRHSLEAKHISADEISPCRPDPAFPGGRPGQRG
jgi:excisionase family DNA binding protein